MIEPTADQHEDDPRTDDEASSVGGSDGSLASIRSSILDYRRENGRTYHRLSDGKYLLPNDEREQDRLDITHHQWTLTWDGKLCNCPKKNGAKRVLDIGTGTGIWALDFADDHPEATVIGVDLSPIQPGYVPPNCSFEVDDIEKEWTWSAPFDFIFMRSMISSFNSWPDMIKKAYDHLEPGGYLEIQDNTFPLKCDDDTMTEDCVTYKWTKLLIEGADKMGRPITVAPAFKQMLKDAGFVDVVEKREIFPMGPWPQDPKLRELGDWSMTSTLRGIEAMSMAIFTRVLDWTVAETQVLCAQVRNELKKQEIHGYYDVYAVYGRKPEKEESVASATVQ